MIRSFGDRKTQALYDGDVVRQFTGIARAALRKLDMLNAATTVEDLRSPPGNRLEMLKGDRAGQYSIRINDQWRVCFVWRDDGPHGVEIVDYHG